MGWLGKGIFYTKQFLNDISGFGKNYADLNILKGELVKAGAIQEIISAYITGQEGSGRGYKPYIFEPNQANAQDNDILKETQAMFAKFIEQQQEFQQQNNLSFRDLVEAFRNAQTIQTKPAGWQGPAGGITRELEQLNKGYIGVREGIN